jgi:hypothetical protein
MLRLPEDEMPSAVKCVEPEQPVNEKRCVKHNQTGIRLPGREQDGARGLHGLDGADAERVIEQVRCCKRE